MPSSENFSPNNVWASTPIQGVEEELTLPSGQTCRAKRMTIQGVLETGMLAQVDSLTGLVDQHTRKVKGGKGVPDGTPVISDNLMRDTKALTTILGVVDSLLPHIVISPNVHPHYTETIVGKTSVKKVIPLTERVPGQVYTDMIDLDDKMFLFDWALGGLQSFSSFRRETAGDVGGVAPEPRSGGKAKRRNRDR